MYSVHFGFVPVVFLNVLQVIKAKIEDGCYMQMGSRFCFLYHCWKLCDCLPSLSQMLFSQQIL